MSECVLVGHEWKCEGGEKFRLSDHIAVLAVTGIHAAYGGGAEAGGVTVSARRGMVAGRREDLATHERVVVAVNEAAGRQERRLQVQRLSDEELKAQSKTRRRDEEQRGKQLQELREVLYGTGGCFGEQVGELHGALPESLVLAEDVVLPGVDAVSGAEASVAWPQPARGRYPRLLGLCNPDARKSFALSVAQVFLRAPALAVWMSAHERSCAAGDATGRGSCVLCAPWRTREQLGLRAVPDILLHLATVGAEYTERQERDVVAFAKKFFAVRAGSWA